MRCCNKFKRFIFNCTSDSVFKRLSRSGFSCLLFCFSAIPNFLSVLRIILTLFFVVSVINSSAGTALSIFFIAAISDFLDGYIARRFKLESVIGSVLDPLADKFLMITSYLFLGLMGLIPALLSAIVILRDIIILSVVSLCKHFKVELKFHPLYSSKVNTTLQLIYVILILACWYFIIDVPSVLNVCAMIVGVSTVYSALDYVRNYYWIKDAICSRKK